MVTAAQLARFFDPDEILRGSDPRQPLTGVQLLQSELVQVFRVSRTELDPDQQRVVLDFAVELVAREAARRW